MTRTIEVPDCLGDNKKEPVVLSNDSIIKMLIEANEKSGKAPPIYKQMLHAARKVVIEEANEKSS